LVYKKIVSVLIQPFQLTQFIDLFFIITFANDDSSLILTECAFLKLKLYLHCGKKFFNKIFYPNNNTLTKPLKFCLFDQKKNVDWLVMEKLTRILRTFDPLDPVKYDFALFGSGVNENKRS